LVSIPVEIYSATKSGASISFHQVHEPSGKRIKYEKVVPGIGPVDRDEIVKGYEVSKGHYVLLDPEEIEAVKLESKKTLDLVQFVDVGDIDAMYSRSPITSCRPTTSPRKRSSCSAMRSKAKKVGIGQLAMRGQEYVVSAEAVRRAAARNAALCRRGHKAQLFPRDRRPKPDQDLLDLASTLIEKKTGKFDAANSTTATSMR
jgi:DNA end-binding protein Ku